MIVHEIGLPAVCLFMVSAALCLWFTRTTFLRRRGRTERLAAGATQLIAGALDIVAFLIGTGLFLLWCIFRTMLDGLRLN